MSKKEAPIETLQQFLPAGTYDAIISYLRQHKVHLTISRKRNSILGDYRHKTNYTNHRISVNGNLNSYSFLITLLHELAHLLTFEQFGHNVQSHGREWKMIYSGLLNHFLKNNLFPPDIESELLRSISNPAASSCAEDGLIRVLKKYDLNGSVHQLLEELPSSSLFRIEDGRVFKKGKRLRKRFKCVEIRSGKEYLFSPVYDVILVNGE